MPNWSSCTAPTPTLEPEKRPKPIGAMRNVDKTVLLVCSRTGLTQSDLRQPTRTKRYTEARQLLYWLLREGHGLSFHDIGHIVRRDHTTVISGLKSHRRRMDRSDLWRQLSEELLDEIGGRCD